MLNRVNDHGDGGSARIGELRRAVELKVSSLQAQLKHGMRESMLLFS